MIRAAFIFWTRWPFEYRDVNIEELASAVIENCWELAHNSPSVRPASIAIIKTPGTAADDKISIEESIWREAFVKFQDSQPRGRTKLVSFIYLPIHGLPVCSAWSGAWQLSKWWESDAQVLAFPAMDLVETLLSDELRITSHRDIPDDIDIELANALKQLPKLLKIVSDSEGLAVGGYRTVEIDPDRQQLIETPLKDVIEDAARRYTLGKFCDFAPLQELLVTQHPDFRIRSETIALHRKAWGELKSVRRMDPWAGTCQLVLEALQNKIPVDQEDLGIMLEEGGKPPRVFVEQLDRFKFVVDRCANHQAKLTL